MDFGKATNFVRFGRMESLRKVHVDFFLESAMKKDIDHEERHYQYLIGGPSSALQLPR